MKRVVRPFSRRSCLILIVLLLVALPASPAAASDPEPEAGPYPYAPGEVLISWQADSTELPRGAPPKRFAADQTSEDWQTVVQTLEARTGLTVLEAEPYYGLARLSVPVGQEQAEVARLSALPWIQYAEPNYIAHAADTYPTDFDPYLQWNMLSVYAPAAWDLTMGANSIVVAVVDSGIDLSHPEFAGRRRPGWDYVRDDAYPDDEFGHGTHVAGILAAAANSGGGVVGLAPNVKILPLKVLDNTGSGLYSDIALAIQKAADDGVPIINLSLQGLAPDNILYGAVVYAASRGKVLVAAAGNYGDKGNPPVYPGDYPEVFTVAASKQDDDWASYSTYNDHVDLAAPGGIPLDQIWSTVPTSSYGYRYGTSMAAPLVSAAAALFLTCVPTATRQEITDRLKETADKVGSILYDVIDDRGRSRNVYFGYGRLNAASAVRLPSLNPSPSGTQSFLLGDPVQLASRQISLTNSSQCPVMWEASVPPEITWLTLPVSSGTANFSAPGSLSIVVNSTGLPTGQYSGLIHVSYNGATFGFDIPVQLRVVDPLYRVFLPLATSQ